MFFDSFFSFFSFFCCNFVLKFLKIHFFFVTLEAKMHDYGH